MKSQNRLYYDAEFTELSRNGRLISLAFVADDNSLFYAEFNDFPEEGLNEWMHANVLSNLLFREKENHIERSVHSVLIKDSSHKISVEFRNWIEPLGDIEIYADCPAFDWVFFCDLFGTAFDIPKSIFYIPFDVATLLKSKNIHPDISREEFVMDHLGPDALETIKKTAIGKHNALYDALVIQNVTAILETIK